MAVYCYVAWKLRQNKTIDYSYWYIHTAIQVLLEPNDRILLICCPSSWLWWKPIAIQGLPFYTLHVPVGAVLYIHYNIMHSTVELI